MKHAPILQADDDENDVLLLQYAFKTAQIPGLLHAVSDGQQAIDYLSGTGPFADRARFPLPCIVLLDLKMPRKNDLQVLEWIRSQPEFGSLVVIMLTASASQDDIAQAYSLRANAFLIKPAGTDKLTEMVKAIQAYWLTYNLFPVSCRRPGADSDDPT
jgi:CheY-like chemotaxis protein